MGKTLETIKALEEFADKQIQQKKEAQRQLDELKEALGNIDDFLARLESEFHGTLGDDISSERLRIKNILAATKVNKKS